MADSLVHIFFSTAATVGWFLLYRSLNFGGGGRGGAGGGGTNCISGEV